MNRPKYSSEEERKAAQREKRRQRNAAIRQLLIEHRASVALQHAAASLPEVPSMEGDYAGRILRNPGVRGNFIKALLRYHYTELKEAIDAYRLLKEDNG
jgi:hypothetical protein